MTAKQALVLSKQQEDLSGTELMLKVKKARLSLVFIVRRISTSISVYQEPLPFEQRFTSAIHGYRPFPLLDFGSSTNPANRFKTTLEHALSSTFLRWHNCILQANCIRSLASDIEYSETNSSASVKVSGSAANYTPATLDPELRSNINAALIEEGHVGKIQDHLLHSLHSHSSNWPTTVQNHALALLRSGEISTFPALLRRVLEDVRHDTATAQSGDANGSDVNGKKQANGADSTNGNVPAATTTAPSLAVPQAVINDALKVTRESLEMGSGAGAKSKQPGGLRHDGSNKRRKLSASGDNRGYSQVGRLPGHIEHGHGPGGNGEEEAEEGDGRNQGVASGATSVTATIEEDDPSSISDDDQREIIRRHHPRVTNRLPDALRRAGLLPERFHHTRPHDQFQGQHHQVQLQHPQQPQPQQPQTATRPLAGSPIRTHLQPQPQSEPQLPAPGAGPGNGQGAPRIHNNVGTTGPADLSGQPS
ncbi:hypothetical protein B0T20DRAFT_495553 [Sordaria brevicollis]|uniref:Uncharacterized protein n=1 Tax=Sordaria brevicollis TaxID=83679 RepID=A0AAE0UEW8_SORBR|nr:hypothetical protein B0T20DRAFT_495553 [Sordaria brevicollis]